MKAFPSLLCLLTFVAPLPAQQPEPAPQASLKAWETSLIETFELDHATFEEAFAKIKAEWQKQHPDLSLPLAIADYRPEESKSPTITMSLKKVPFAAALEYIGDASHQRLAKDTKLPRIDLGKQPDYDEGITKVYRISPEVAAKLGIEPGASRDAIHAAFERFGVQFPTWAPASFIRGHPAAGEDKGPDGPPQLVLILMGDREQHEVVAGLSSLLGKGFTIIPPEKK